MDFGNQSRINEFIFTAFPLSLQLKLTMFIGLLFVYLLTVLGNGFLICAVVLSPQLHTAMYYFLCNLACIDLFNSSNSMPLTLFNIFAKRRRISVTGCLIQMYSGLIVGGTEYVLLAGMAYDRYIAICFPLHYTTIMSWRTCMYITALMWSGNLILTLTPSIVRPPVFCGENKVNHFSCESLVILELACENISFYKFTIFIGGLCVLFLPLIFIVVSYICIIISILKISSGDGRSKAFSTCTSHLVVVFLFFGTSMTTYIGQGKTYSSNIKYISIIYGCVIPVLNPFIYSLRNKDVKGAFQKMLTRYSASRSL